MRARSLLTGGALICLGAGAFLFGRAVYLDAKAALARVLIERAFDAHLRDGRPHRPWAWADTYPIAVLELDRLGVRRLVLAGASGSSLAFGVGHVDGTAFPNGTGRCALAGHRDGVFAFLEKVRPGDVLRLRTRSTTLEYVVDGMEVVPHTDVRYLQEMEGRRLLLVTCYPFGGLVRSPWRFVVMAEARDTGQPGGITIPSLVEIRPYFF